MTAPPGELAEAATWLRPGCVVSLQTVLGDSGVWNNYTSMVTAVVPFASSRPRPSLGIRTTLAGRFQFRGMPEVVLLAGREADRLADVTGYVRATPEAALVHWLYLAASSRSNLMAPPLDLDMHMLNAARLRRLAEAMNLSGELAQWSATKRAHDQSPSVIEQTWIPD
jgi:hypothetical protein